MTPFLISIIIPVYNEELQIRESVSVIEEIMIRSNIRYEFILVDDGSVDNSWEIIKEIANSNDKVNAIRLSRNFGKEAAIRAGMNSVNGDACIIIDADLQHCPEIIPEMVRKWHEEGYDIVEGVKIAEKRSRMKRILPNLLYFLYHRLTGYNLRNSTDFKLLGSNIISIICNMNEYNMFFRGITSWVGFKRATIPFIVPERKNGKSKWTRLKLIKLATTAITSFSAIPLHIVTILGVLFLFFALIIGMEALYEKLNGWAVNGFTTIMFVLIIIGSTIMISLGIIGAYIAKIFEEIKARPKYLIAESIKHCTGKPCQEFIDDIKVNV